MEIEKEKKSNVQPSTSNISWLNAWTDPLANLKAHSSLLGLVDLNNDGDNKLVAGDLEKRLRIWKGTDLISEHALMDLPVALCIYYMQDTFPKKPAIAVASGSNIYIYKNLKPFFKFTLPAMPADTRELEIWTEMKERRLNVLQGCEKLIAIKDSGVKLTMKSLDLLGFSNLEEKEDFFSQNRESLLNHQTVITCMTVLHKNREEEASVGSLVVGTENGMILVLQPSASSIFKKIQLKSVPAFIVTSGMIDVEYRIIVACRNGSLYTIKNGEMSSESIDLEVQPVGLIRVDRHIMVGCMNNTICAYQVRGKKSFSIHLPSSIRTMEELTHGASNTRCLLVALANCEEQVLGMKFGSFGREGSVLILALQSGALTCKVMARNSNLSPNSGSKSEQEATLELPKKTKLYMQQVKRERESSVEIHKIFQRELYKLRLTIARNYSKIITNSQNAQSYVQGSSVRLAAQIAGIGPVFKIKLAIENTGKKVLGNLKIIFCYNQALYKLRKPYFILPSLIPGLIYLHEVVIECVQDSAGSDNVRIVVFSNAASTVPLISYVITMPISELFF